MHGDTLYWVETKLAGKLALSARPSGGEYLVESISAWRQMSITHVVSLLEAHEVYELGLNAQADICLQHGIQFFSYPIADRGVPESQTSLQRLLQQFHAELIAGSRVVVHCRAGIGRTGLVAASLLILTGVPFEEVFALLSTARRAQVPDTAEQYEWVKNFAARQSQRGENF